MSGWTIFAICFTTLLLGAGAAFTLLMFYRAERKTRVAELEGRAPGRRADGRGR